MGVIPFTRAIYFSKRPPRVESSRVESSRVDGDARVGRCSPLIEGVAARNEGGPLQKRNVREKGAAFFLREESPLPKGGKTHLGVFVLGPS